MKDSPVFRPITITTRRMVTADSERSGKDYFSAKFTFFLHELVSYGEASTRGIALDCVEVTLSNGKNYYLIDTYNNFHEMIEDLKRESEKVYKSIFQN